MYAASSSEFRCFPEPEDHMRDRIPQISARLTKEVLVPEAEKRGYNLMSEGQSSLKTYLPQAELFGYGTWEENGFVILLSATKYRNEKSLGEGLVSENRVDLQISLDRNRHSVFPHLSADISMTLGESFYPCKKSERSEIFYNWFTDIPGKDLTDERNFVKKWLDELDKFPFPNSKRN